MTGCAPIVLLIVAWLLHICVCEWGCVDLGCVINFHILSKVAQAKCADSWEWVGRSPSQGWYVEIGDTEWCQLQGGGLSLGSWMHQEPPEDLPHIWGPATCSCPQQLWVLQALALNFWLGTKWVGHGFYSVFIISTAQADAASTNVLCEINLCCIRVQCLASKLLYS